MARQLLYVGSQRLTRFTELHLLPPLSFGGGANFRAASVRAEGKTAYRRGTFIEGEPLTFADYFDNEPLFSELDYEIARDVLRGLSHRDFKIIYLRFWQNHSILQIAALLGSSWKSVDHSLQRAMAFIKEECLCDPRFSRNEPFARLLAAL